MNLNATSAPSGTVPNFSNLDPHLEDRDQSSAGSMALW